MEIYLESNVYEEAKKRIAWVFDEFETVIVSMSGGKDSCVVFNLCMEEAMKRNRLPLPVMFVDQEGEWQMTIDYIKKVMYDQRVKPYWIQCPVKLFNATSHQGDNWLHCWREGDKWMREKDPISIKENRYGTDRFKELMTKVIDVEFAGKKTANIGGVRCEESPMRRNGLTNLAKYKYVTWGKSTGNDHYVFYPIYDWSYTDVWKSILDNHWEYNKVYDHMYRLGVAPSKMRVSNLNHETAVSSLYHLQEIEPDTWNKMCARLEGVDTTAKIDYRDNFQAPAKVPPMFKDWKEYRDYLLDHLVLDKEQHKTYEKKFEQVEKSYFGYPYMQGIYKAEVAGILANDYFFTKLDNVLNSCFITDYRDFMRGKKLKNRSGVIAMLNAMISGSDPYTESILN